MSKQELIELLPILVVVGAIFAAVVVSGTRQWWRRGEESRILSRWGVPTTYTSKWTWYVYWLNHNGRFHRESLRSFHNFLTDCLWPPEYWLVHGYGEPSFPDGPAQATHLVHKGHVDLNGWNCVADAYQFFEDGDSGQSRFRLVDRNGRTGTVITQMRDLSVLFAEVLSLIAKHPDIADIWIAKISREGSDLLEKTKGTIKSPILATLRAALEYPNSFPDGLNNNLLPPN